MKERKLSNRRYSAQSFWYLSSFVENSLHGINSYWYMQIGKARRLKGVDTLSREPIYSHFIIVHNVPCCVKNLQSSVDCSDIGKYNEQWCKRNFKHAINHPLMYKHFFTILFHEKIQVLIDRYANIKDVTYPISVIALFIQKLQIYNRVTK